MTITMGLSRALWDNARCSRALNVASGLVWGSRVGYYWKGEENNIQANWHYQRKAPEIPCNIRT